MHPTIPGLPGFQLNPRTIGGLAAAAVPVLAAWSSFSP